MRLGQSRFPTLQSACFYFELRISDHARHSKLRGNEEPGKRQNKSAGIRGWPADVIGCSFASDWLRGWYEFSGPIKGRSKIKQSSPRSPSTQNSLSHPLSFFFPFFQGNNRLTDASVKVLARSCPLLEHVYLVDCPRMTDLALKALATSKHLHVVNVADCVR